VSRNDFSPGNCDVSIFGEIEYAVELSDLLKSFKATRKTCSSADDQTKCLDIYTVDGEVDSPKSEDDPPYQTSDVEDGGAAYTVDDLLDGFI